MTNRQADRPPRAAAKVWLFRVLTAVGIPAVLFLGLEGALRLAGFGHPADFLIPDEKPGFFRTNPDFAGLFLPGNFGLRPLNFRLTARKPAHTVRIVVLGESAAQGVPAPAFAFAPQLRAQLRARYPGKEIEVINTGIVAINSHVVYQIARNLAGFSPDLFVVYLGNNEVVGPYGPGCAYLSERPPLWIIRLSVFVRSTRTGQLMAALLDKLAQRRGPPPEWGGMAMFVNNAVSGDDPRLEAVYRNFEANLRDIVGVATDAGAQTLLCTVVSNLKDCAPLLSRHQSGLTPTGLAAWQQAFDRGKLAWMLGETAVARTDLLAAWRLDPHYAETAFMLGTLALQLGDMAAARKNLLEAQHWDALRFRPDPRINAIIRQVARDRAPGTSLLDAAVQLGSDPASKVMPAGRELLFEHVHFDWEGNYQMARLMAEGAEAALFGDKAGRPPWLDSAACAAAFAYTAQGRLIMLQKTADIVRNPPFTNQLTYGEDQAKLAREIVHAESAARDAEILRQAKDSVQAAMVQDPENPTLAAIMEGIDLELGDTAGALAQARRTAQLLPADLGLFADEASLLSQLGRHGEAEEVLRRAERALGEPEKIAPSFAALYARMKRFEEGRGFLDRAIARHPGDGKLRMMRGTLARLAGNTAAAEREYRALLTDDQGNQAALEALVGLLGERGQQAAIEQISLEVAEEQAMNQPNNLRVAMIYEARGDEVQSLRFMSAVERSGPATAAMELRIAKKQYKRREKDEMMMHLAAARRLSVIEEDPESTEAIGQLINRLQTEMP